MAFFKAAAFRFIFSEAVHYYQLSADQDNALAQNSYGRCLETGRNVSVDFSEVVRYYKMSPDQGNDHGQVDYGLCPEVRRGVSIDLLQAG
jgi:TPR repeat protein